MLRALMVLAGVACLVATGVAASVQAAESSVLSAGQQLTAGQDRRSPDGAYRLVMQGDGNVVVYASAGRVVWSSGTSRSPGARLVMQGDGNLVIYNAAGTPIWHTRSSGHPGARAAMQIDGNLVVYSSANKVLWSSGPDRLRFPPAPTGDTLSGGRQLSTGQSLTAANGRYRLVMQSDGNVVVYAGDGRAAWSSGTSRSPGSRLVMRTDGNLVIVNPAGAVVWQTRTAGHAGSRTVLQSDGNVVVYTTGNRPIWDSGPDRAGLPLAVNTGSSTRLVTVTVATSSSTTGRLTAWEKRGTGWVAVLGPVTARVGASGIGQAQEGHSRTPAGTYTLTESFGRLANPGTALPYRVIDGNDWWVSDVNSAQYNRYARCAPGSCPFNEAAGENLWAQGSAYDHAVVIDYNRAGTRGAGSAFFLHVTNGLATAGCVAIDRPSLVALMRWLTPGTAPLISIGVG